MNEICRFFDNYTLHDVNHSLRVLDNMCKLAGYSNIENLSDLEIAMIIYVALLHDIGMWVDSDKGEIEEIKKQKLFTYYLRKNSNDNKLALQDYLRPIHGKRTYEFLLSRVYPIIRFYRIFEEIFRLCKEMKSDVCPEAHKDEPTKQSGKLTERAMKWNYGIDPSEKIKGHMMAPELSTVSFLEDVALICQSHMESLEWVDNNLQESFRKG